jgi:hypothetical protein
LNKEKKSKKTLTKEKEYLNALVVEASLEQRCGTGLNAHHARNLTEHDGKKVATLGRNKRLCMMSYERKG